MPTPTLDETIGAALIGVIISSFLHGVTCIQAWYYFMHQNDKWPTKALVSGVMIFDTIHQILISHTIYVYVVSSFGDYAMLQNLVWSLIVEVLFNGLSAFLVQSFLTIRVWRLSNKNYWITGLIVLLVLGELICIVVFTAMALRFHTFVELATIKNLSRCINAFAAAGDLAIAATLCGFLHKSRTGFRRSDTMINKLIIFTVNTGCFTTLCAIASLVAITVSGHTFIYIAFFFCIGRLYANSLLATLNAREMIRNASGDGIHSSAEISHSLRDIPKTAPIGTGRGNNISIKIDTTKEFATDGDSEQDQKGSAKKAY